MMARIEAWASYVREMMVTTPEVMALVIVGFAIMGAILIRFRPEQAARFREWVRIGRYCHSCPFIKDDDGCSVGAKYNERCGLIDKTAGMSFTVTKNG